MYIYTHKYTIMHIFTYIYIYIYIYRLPPARPRQRNRTVSGATHRELTWYRCLRK